MSVLVTGGGGFIGSHLCERLLRGAYEVVSLDSYDDFYDPAIKRGTCLSAGPMRASRRSSATSAMPER